MGAFVGFNGGYLRIRAGNGGSAVILLQQVQPTIWHCSMFLIQIWLRRDLRMVNCMI